MSASLGVFWFKHSPSLEQDQQQRQQLPGRSQLGVGQQAGYGFGRELVQGQSIASFSGVDSPYGQQAQSGHAQGIYRFVCVCVRARVHDTQLQTAILVCLTILYA